MAGGLPHLLVFGDQGALAPRLLGSRGAIACTIWLQPANSLMQTGVLFSPSRQVEKGQRAVV